MKRLTHSGTAVAGFVAALTFTSGALAMGYSPEHDFGSQPQGAHFDRVITIAPDAKWINVNRNETVKLVDASSGKSLVWRFDTPATTFPLSKMASSGILSGRQIDVYIAQPNID